MPRKLRARRRASASRRQGRSRLRRSNAAGPASWVGRDPDLPPAKGRGIEQVERASCFRSNPDDGSDGQKRCEIADRARERTEHAEFGTGIAIVGIEGVADETTVTGLASEQCDLSLELLGGCGNERDA